MRNLDRERGCGFKFGDFLIEMERNSGGGDIEMVNDFSVLELEREM